MGWIVVIAIKPLMRELPTEGLIWLAAGGLSYMFGVFFFMATGLRYSHLIWHFFVMAGTACHFVSVFKYAI